METRRVTYGWLEDAELQDVKPTCATPAAAQSSMHACRDSPRDQSYGERGQNAVAGVVGGPCSTAGALGRSTGSRSGAAAPPGTSSSLRASGSSDLESSAARGARHGDPPGPAGTPPHGPTAAYSPLPLAVPPQGATSPGRHAQTPPGESDWANSICSQQGGLQQSGSLGPTRQQSTGSVFGTASGQFASPIGSMAWSGVSGSAAGGAISNRSQVVAPQVGHWHWASSAPPSHPAMHSTHYSMHSNHSGTEDHMAWVYGAAGDGDEAMFNSMRSTMQSSMHASVHDTEYRRMYMQAALQRSYNAADEQQQSRPAERPSSLPRDAVSLSRSTPPSSPPV